jgi:hypothetical protein
MPELHKIIKTVILAYNIEGFDEYVADKIAMEITEKYKPILLNDPLTADEDNDRKHMVKWSNPSYYNPRSNLSYYNPKRTDRMISVDRVMEIIDKAFDDAVPVREKHSQG